MAVTRLKRKDRANSAKATERVIAIKRLTKRPVIKRVDVEAIKQSFADKA
jgi:hypothetical protein